MNITEKFDLKIPLFQAPLETYPNQAKLVAEASQHGALGVYSANYQTLEEIDDTLKTIRDTTDRAFAILVDVRNGENDLDLADRSGANSYLKEAYQTLDIKTTDELILPQKDELMNTILSASPAAVIFQNGLPSDEIIETFKATDIVTMAIASNPLEVIVASKYVDVIILQGLESAGIHSQFNNTLNASSYPISALLHQALGLTDKPLIVWGDYQYPQNIVGALINGASSVMVDTLFWTTQESPIPDSYRQALLEHNEMLTINTPVWVGYRSLCLQNELTRLAQSKYTSLSPQKQQRIMLPVIRAAIDKDCVDYLPLWAGYCAVTTEKNVAELCAKYKARLDEIIS